jgi:VIT1/CCC1 family predicted Fe2+/Mn2+ transporter
VSAQNPGSQRRGSPHAYPTALSRDRHSGSLNPRVDSRTWLLLEWSTLCTMKAALTHLLSDLLSALVYLAVFALTGKIAIAASVAVTVALLQFGCLCGCASSRFRRCW